MTREEEIRQAALERGCIERTAEYYGFIEGARYSDQHPKSPWISVNERLPKRSKSKYNYDNMYFVAREGCSMAFVAILHKNGKWYIPDHMQYTEIVAPDYWMPMPKLPKTEN